MQLYKLFPTGKGNVCKCNFIFVYYFLKMGLRVLKGWTTVEEDVYLLNLSLIY